jgi:hypothetical protein
LAEGQNDRSATLPGDDRHRSATHVLSLPTTDQGVEIELRIKQGLNTDRMLTGKELVPMSYGNRGGPRSSSNGLPSEQFPTDGLTSPDDRSVCIRVQSVFNPWLKVPEISPATAEHHGTYARTGLSAELKNRGHSEKILRIFQES